MSLLNCREFPRAALVLITLLLPGGVGGTEPPARRPNFVFFLVDDLGWRDVGCFGSTFYETPNIDRLARQGMRFTNAYAACPVCSPTRASIMTGKYPVRMAATNFFGAPEPNEWKRPTVLLPAEYSQRLPLEEVTVAEALQEAGYKTFFAGKWHLGPRGYYPEDQGFEINKGGLDWGAPPTYFAPYGNPKLPEGPKGEHLPDRLATETCRFIEQAKGGPFLAYLSFYSVHVPLMGREDLIEKYRKKAQLLPPVDRAWGQEGANKVRLVQDLPVYAAMVEAMDQAVGKVLDTLGRLDLEGNTVVIFMSDNGGLATAEGHPTSNLPLRAGKGWLYEGGIREPVIFRWPGVIPAGGTCEAPVISNDFYPTMLALAGLPGRPGQHCDGVSLAPLLKGGGGLSERPLFWHYPHYSNQGGAPSAAIRQGQWKLIEFYEDRQVELYDLESDLGETTDLAGTMPGKARELLGRLHVWQKDTGARFPTPNPNHQTDEGAKAAGPN